MQPASKRLRLKTARKTTSYRPRAAQGAESLCARASALRRLLRLHRLNNLTLLEGHRGLAYDRFVAMQSGLDVDRGPQVTAEDHRLEMQLVSRAHDRDAGALRIEDDRGRRNPPVRAAGADL